MTAIPEGFRLKPGKRTRQVKLLWCQTIVAMTAVTGWSDLFKDSENFWFQVLSVSRFVSEIEMKILTWNGPGPKKAQTKASVKPWSWVRLKQFIYSWLMNHEELIASLKSRIWLVNWTDRLCNFETISIQSNDGLIIFHNKWRHTAHACDIQRL